MLGYTKLEVAVFVAVDRHAATGGFCFKLVVWFVWKFLGRQNCDLNCFGGIVAGETKQSFTGKTATYTWWPIA